MRSARVSDPGVTAGLSLAVPGDLRSANHAGSRDSRTTALLRRGADNDDNGADHASNQRNQDQ